MDDKLLLHFRAKFHIQSCKEDLAVDLKHFINRKDSKELSVEENC